MSKNPNSMVGTIVRLGSVAALSATFVAGVAPSTFAQDSRQNAAPYRDLARTVAQRYDQNPYRRRSLGRNRYRYTYNGRDYDYTVDNRRGNEDPREVADRARQNGYQQGLQEGQYDASGGSSKPNPQGHGAYQFALDGWDQEWGSGLTYQRAYREGYLRGYNEAFSRNRGPVRRPGRGRRY